MNIGDMSKGAPIELIVRCNGKTMDFKSEITLIKDSYVLITGIKVDNQTVGFSDKCTISFLYKYDGKVFLWENVSVKLVKFDDDIFHKIDILGDGKPHNRREAYRMYLGEDMAIYVNSPSGPSALSVLVKDISETGVCFISKEDLDINRTFRLRLKDNDTIISLSGVIVRKEPVPNLSSNLYGCKFSEKNNMLVKFIARRQGEQLRGKSRFSSPQAKKDYAMK